MNIFPDERSGQALPESLLRAAPQGKIPSPKQSPPLVPLGLHGLLCGFRAINAKRNAKLHNK